MENHKLIERILSLLKLLQQHHIEIDQLVECGGQLPHPLFGADLDRTGLQTALELIRFMDEMPGGFLIYHADQGEEIVYANKGLLRIFQCDSMSDFRALTRASFRGIVHPEDLEAVEESIQRQIAASQYDLDYVEYRVIRKDGEIRWIEDYGHFIHTDFIGDIFYVFLADATEKQLQHQFERAALIHESKEKEQKLQSLIQTYDKERALIRQEHLRRLEVIEGLSVNYESIFYANLDRNTVLPYRLSIRTKTMFDQTLQSREFSWYTSHYVETWVYPEDREQVAQAMSPAYIREALADNNTFYINYRVLYHGKVQYMQLRVVNVGHTGHISQIVMGYRRMDEELQRELEQKQVLEEALKNAHLAITAKDTFLSNMSHDMRTPLNAIFGFSALARTHLDQPETVCGYLDRVEDAGKQLLDLINKLLELSWTGSSQGKPVELPCSVCGIMEDLRDALLSKAQEKGLSLSMDCSAVAHSAICSDPEKLKQLLLHLGNNAVLYTPPGGCIRLRASEMGYLTNQYGVYQFAVEDTGVGIEPDFLTHIFEPFAREQNTTLSGIHGAGLGLTIAKQICDTFGGTIQVQSTPGEGSIFTVTLRLRVPEEPLVPSPAAAAPKSACHSILVVEDNELNLEIETELLQAFGFQIDIAANGKAAFEKIRDSRPGEFDLILMDIQMPVMDGWQSARAIRSLDNPALAQIPIIALSANAFDSDIQTSMENGINAHLPKPLDCSLLLKTIEEVTQSCLPTA